MIKDLKRQVYLKCAIFALAGFVIGTAVGFIFFKEVSCEKAKTETTAFDEFIIKESAKEISVLDKEGNEILIIDKQ